MRLLCWSALSTLRPLGHIESCWSQKFGAPRQGSVSPDSRARLRVVDCGPGIAPEHALSGLDSYSHVWLIWASSLNGHAATQSKVQVPRLRGVKSGLFSTRSPFRPNPLGLSLVRLQSVQGDTLHLQGVDLVDKTPVLDIKPYIPTYDAPDAAHDVRVAPWVDPPPSLSVVFEPAADAALADLAAIDAANAKTDEVRLLEAESLRRALVQTLSSDPRPLYRWRRREQGGGGGERPDSGEYDVVVDRVTARCRFEPAVDDADGGGAGPGMQERVRVLGLRWEE